MTTDVGRRPAGLAVLVGYVAVAAVAPFLFPVVLGLPSLVPGLDTVGVAVVMLVLAAGLRTRREWGWVGSTILLGLGVVDSLRSVWIGGVLGSPVDLLLLALTGGPADAITPVMIGAGTLLGVVLHGAGLHYLWRRKTRFLGNPPASGE